MGFIDELIKETKKQIPDFDEKNPKHMNKMVEMFVLSNYDNKIIVEEYLSTVVEESFREMFEKMIKDRKFPREELIESETKMLDFKKRIIERQMKVLKEFMN